MSLHTITPKHQDLRQITIKVIHRPTTINIFGAGANVRQVMGEANFGQWLDLDRLLVQLWESRSIRSSAVFLEWGSVRDYIGSLLPEITRRVGADLTKSSACC